MVCLWKITAATKNVGLPYVLGYGNTREVHRGSYVRMWRNNGRRIWRIVVLLACGPLFCACEASLRTSFNGLGERPESGGIIVADEPQAVRIAQEILEIGGSAADAAVTLGFSLSVTLQSSAGLGGGGLCLVYDAERDRADVLDFIPSPAGGHGDAANWQVAVPSLVRGLYALHAKNGVLPWQQVVVPAEKLARSGFTVGRSFALDLSQSSMTLANDPKSLDVFMSSERTMAVEGDRIDLPDLAARLGRIRSGSPTDFYTRDLETSVDSSTVYAGTSLSIDDLRAYVPTWKPAESTKIGFIEYYSAIAFGAHNVEVQRNVARTQVDFVEASHLSKSSAATGFLVADAGGNAVACSLTMVSPFGLGLMPTELGFLLAPSPTEIAEFVPPLFAGIAVDHRARDVHYAAASGGADVTKQIETSVRSLIDGQADLSASFMSSANTEDEFIGGQINAMFCERGLKSGLNFCAVRRDPSGHGFGTIILGDR